MGATSFIIRLPEKSKLKLMTILLPRIPPCRGSEKRGFVNMTDVQSVLADRVRTGSSCIRRQAQEKQLPLA